MKKYIIAIFILLSLSIFFVSLSQKEKSLKQIEKQDNVELAIYINEEETNAIPSKESGYYYDREKSSCTNGAYINWDSITWSPVVNNISEYKTRCELHFTTTYTEGILNGTDPVLKDELVPITIGNDGTCNTAYPNSLLASTTENITGIYDMSGGTHEYMMGVIVNEQDNLMSGRSNLYNSGFIGGLGCPQCDAGTDGSTYLDTGYSWPDAQYYDIYLFSNVYYSYSKRILGDVTSEMGPFSIATAFSTGQERQIGSWYNNLSYTNYYADPWFLRGFSFQYGNDVSIFSYGSARGDATADNTGGTS